MSIEGEIPDVIEIRRLDLTTLPARWHESRDESLHRFGDEWIRSSETTALPVPSAAIRSEWNVPLTTKGLIPVNAERLPIADVLFNDG